MNEPTLDNLVKRMDRLEREARRRPCQMILGLFFLTVLLLTCNPLQASEPRSEYEAPFSGKPLLGILQASTTVSCFSDLSANTGYYGKEEGKPETLLIEGQAEMQARRRYMSIPAFSRPGIMLRHLQGLNFKPY